MTTRSTSHLDEETEYAVDETPSKTNLGRAERAASAVLGGVLLVRGLRRRSLGGAVSAIAGGALLSRGLRGRSRVYRALETNVPTGDRSESRAKAREPVAERSITVGKPAEDLEEFWRDPELLERIVGDFAEVSAAGGNEDEDEGEDRHHWRVSGPLDRPMEWESKLVEERPGELLRWESDADATVSADGSIRFRPAPGDRGTEVTLHLSFDPPGGAVGDAVADRLGIVPETLAAKTLHRFKSLIEAGEIPTLEGNPSGRGRGISYESALLGGRRRPTGQGRPRA